jgi:hypothetical protein
MPVKNDWQIDPDDDLLAAFAKKLTMPKADPVPLRTTGTFGFILPSLSGDDDSRKVEDHNA